MVFNSAWVLTVARSSAELWQYVACNPERLSNEQVLDLLFCLPLRHLRRLALSLFSFICFPISIPPTLPFPSSFSSSSSSSSSPSYPSHFPPSSSSYRFRRSQFISSSSSSSSCSSSSSSDEYDPGYVSHSD